MNGAAFSPSASEASLKEESELLQPSPPSSPSKPRRQAIQRAIQHAKHSTTSRDIVLFLVAFRILNALSIRTFFQPDEYFQSLEPGWQIAFGPESGAWTTWEWKNHLRSSIHPWIFGAVYWLSARVANLLSLDAAYRAELLIAAPKILQALISARGDYFTWKLAQKLYGRDSNESWVTLVLTVCSPWQWFCSTRTLSNCLETTLTITALTYWPWQLCSGTSHERKPDMDGMRTEEVKETSQDNEVDASRLRRCLLLAALACVLRPTNILIWACLASFSVLKWSQKEILVLVREVISSGAVVLAIGAIFDRAFYGQWTFPPYRFIYFNIAQSLAVFYGRNDWHYYLSQGYPLLLTTFLPFAVVSIYKALRAGILKQPSTLLAATQTQLATVAVAVPAILSFISHKEVRFIYPLLPMLHVLAADSFTKYFYPAFASILPRSRLQDYHLKVFILTGLLGLNIIIALFATQFHQTAPLSVLDYLRHEHEKYYLTQPPTTAAIAPADTSMTVGFLMPCHSTPWRSHLVHPGIKAWALSCEPPVHLNVSDRAGYRDEADQFYDNPKLFLETRLGKLQPLRGAHGRKMAQRGLGIDQAAPHNEEGLDGKTGAKHWPHYLVYFENIEQILNTVTAGSGYSQCWRGWSSYFHDDRRRRGDIIVWCLRKHDKVAVPEKINGKLAVG